MCKLRGSCVPSGRRATLMYVPRLVHTYGRESARAHAHESVHLKYKIETKLHECSGVYSAVCTSEEGSKPWSVVSYRVSLLKYDWLRAITSFNRSPITYSAYSIQISYVFQFCNYFYSDWLVFDRRAFSRVTLLFPERERKNLRT